MGRALLVVDVQVDFCEGGALAVAGGAQVARDVSAHLAAHAGGYALVAASRDWHTPGESNGGHIAWPPLSPQPPETWPPHCVAGTPGADYQPGLDLTRITAHVRKGQGAPGYSAFSGTVDGAGTLAETLLGAGIDTLEVCGIATDHCVLASARDALALGLSVVVLDDLVAGVDPTASAAGLATLVDGGATLRRSAA